MILKTRISGIKL